MFEDDWIHGSVLSLEDQLGWHQSTLTHTGGMTGCINITEEHLQRSFSRRVEKVRNDPEHTLKSVAVSGTMPLILI